MQYIGKGGGNILNIMWFALLWCVSHICRCWLWSGVTHKSMIVDGVLVDGVLVGGVLPLMRCQRAGCSALTACLL